MTKSGDVITVPTGHRCVSGVHNAQTHEENIKVALSSSFAQFEHFLSLSAQSSRTARNTRALLRLSANSLRSACRNESAPCATRTSREDGRLRGAAAERRHLQRHTTEGATIVFNRNLFKIQRKNINKEHTIV